MSEYTLSAAPLWTADPFRRWIWVSATAHVVLLLVLAIGPGLSAPPKSPAVFVDLVAAPAPARPKAKAKAAPARRQVVDEAIVLRKQPKPAPPKKKQPKPPPEKKPQAATPTPEEIMAQLRAKVAERAPAAAALPGSRTGRPEDPELAAYKARVMTCLYEHWAGARAFSRQPDLEVQFRVRVGADGRVRSVSLTRSSSNRYLDESAERAVWKCDPFDSPPPDVTEFNLTFNPADLV